MKLLVLAVLWFTVDRSVLAREYFFEELDGNFEGDIVSTVKDIHRERSGLIATRYRWTDNTVPYVFVDLDSGQASQVRATLDEMEAVLCVTFIPRTIETNYVQMIFSTSGCSSYVGMIGGVQDMKLSSGCLGKGYIMELFMFALGLHHMHSAPDRDNYVKIIWENIQPGHEHNFEILDPDRYSQFGVPYDYGSIMHYSHRSYSVNGFPTIVPLDPTVVIGQRVGLSELDIQRVRNMYCP